mmetsp:Transcript_2848/g.8939  ORF Transcript_2848/g.8939 Transcript_2848/m.8939 type:complete len:215 (+) Transcript_2848:362-1006(+)
MASTRTAASQSSRVPGERSAACASVKTSSPDAEINAISSCFIAATAVSRHSGATPSPTTISRACSSSRASCSASTLAPLGGDPTSRTTTLSPHVARVGDEPHTSRCFDTDPTISARHGDDSRGDSRRDDRTVTSSTSRDASPTSTRIFSPRRMSRTKRATCHRQSPAGPSSSPSPAASSAIRSSDATLSPPFDAQYDTVTSVPSRGRTDELSAR